MPKVGHKVFAAALAALLINSSIAFAAKKSKKAEGQSVQVASGKEPDWLYAKPAAYPESRYMTASGSAQFQNSADNDALLNFASVFSQYVSSNQNANRKMEQDREGSVSKESSWEQNLNLRVDSSELIGVEIRERYFDGKKYHSLAVMDKEEAIKLYKSAIEANNKDIERLEAYTKGNSIDRFSNLFIAQSKAAQNKNYLDRMFVINADQAKAIVLKSPDEIRALRVEVAKKIPVYVRVNGDKDSMAYAALCELLNDYGFRVSKSQTERYSLLADFSLEQKLSKDKTSWQSFFSLSCALNDSATSGALWTDSIKGRAASFNEEDSLDRAKMALEKKVEGDLNDSFVNFLLGSVKN